MSINGYRSFCWEPGKTNEFSLEKHNKNIPKLVIGQIWGTNGFAYICFASFGLSPNWSFFILGKTIARASSFQLKCENCRAHVLFDRHIRFHVIVSHKSMSKDVFFLVGEQEFYTKKLIQTIIQRIFPRSDFFTIFTHFICTYSL